MERQPAFYLWVLFFAFQFWVYGRLRCFYEEERALFELKSSINHPNGTSLPSWRVVTDCCSWDEVMCDSSTGRVIELYCSYARGEELGNWHLNASLLLPFEELQSLHSYGSSSTGLIDEEGVKVNKSISAVANERKYEGVDCGGNMGLVECSGWTSLDVPINASRTTWVWTIDYETVRFSTKDVTNDSYSQFIESMRNKLASGDERHGIPIMRNRSTVLRDGSKWFLLVDLSNGASEYPPITVAVNVTNAYVVAYRTGNRSFFLNDPNPDPAMSKLFPSTHRENLSFGSSYRELESTARQNRSVIELGMTKLDLAITSLRISKMDQQRTLARSLIVVIQMIVEAVRFEYIKQQVLGSMTKPFQPDPGMCSRESNWGALSTAVQKSSNGEFSRPILLVNSSGVPFNVSSVGHEAIKGLKIMLFSCKLSRSKSGRASSNQFRIDHLLMMTMLTELVLLFHL